MNTDSDTNNEHIKNVITQSLETAPEKLGADFYDVGWNLPRWHILMLQDRPRLEYYSNVIKPKVAGKIVLDVGTGSGILSYLALKWGAKKVYSVEMNPALQGAYRHLMRVPLQEGRAELICDDASYLRLEQFTEGPPEVVVHELFGSFGMGENLIPIFHALTKEGILTPKTELIPDNLEVWTRPVWSDLVAKEEQVSAFEGYPLDQLNIFTSQNLWEQDYLASKASNWKAAGDSQMVFKCNLRDLSLPDNVTLTFSASHSSHLQIWMKIKDDKTGLVLENDHHEGGSHWANVFLAIPFWLRGKDFKVEIKIEPNKIQVLRFF